MKLDFRPIRLIWNTRLLDRHVLDADGRYLVRVDIPPIEDRSVVAIGADRIAIGGQPSGVPTVVVYDIVRAGDAPGTH